MFQGKGKAPERDAEQLRREKDAAVIERASKRAANSERKRIEAEEFKTNGNTLFKEGDYAGAIHMWAHAVDINGPRPAFMSNLAAAYLKVGDYETAEETSCEALLHDPKFLKARFRRAMARKGENLLKAAITDLKVIVKLDPQNVEAQSELTSIRILWERGEGEDTGNTTSDDEYPPPDEEALEIQSVSDSSDCAHDGNGIPCRFYNRDGCLRGTNCEFSHAPDNKSVRDKLGRNVCLYFLMNKCKFGAAKCTYSHDKSYLPESGFWNDQDGIQQLNALLEVLELESRPKPRPGKGKARRGRGNGGRRQGRTVYHEQAGGSTTERGRENRRHRHGARRKSPQNPSGWLMDDDEVEERMMNYGYTEDELSELLCQGIKPWDDDDFY